VNKDEIDALAKRRGLSVEEFERQFVRRVGARKSLIEYDNGDCVFFDGQSRRCTVYEDRPRQCRTWPFWDSNVRTEAAWRETCAVCPGSGHGTLVTVEKILEQLAVIRV
jgi:Fe-S-cluster containining protein